MPIRNSNPRSLIYSPGYFKAANCVFDLYHIKALGKLVLLYLLRRANNKGKCWVSIARIAKECGIGSLNTARTIIKDLRKEHCIEVIARPGTSNIYRVNPIFAEMMKESWDDFHKPKNAIQKTALPNSEALPDIVDPPLTDSEGVPYQNCKRKEYFLKEEIEKVDSISFFKGKIKIAEIETSSASEVFEASLAEVSEYIYQLSTSEVRLFDFEALRLQRQGEPPPNGIAQKRKLRQRMLSLLKLGSATSTFRVLNTSTVLR